MGAGAGEEPDPNAGRSYVEVPKITTPGIIPLNWPETCVVSRREIIGRVWAVYNPPPKRRVVR